MKPILFIFCTILSFLEVNGQKKENLYPIKVEIKEVKNRTLSCKVRNHEIIVDQPEAFGGNNLGATPPEMLAIAYGSCVVSTIQLLCTIRQLDIKDIIVKVEGSIDFSKALGIDDKNRAGFGNLKTSVSFKSTLTKEQKIALLDDVFKIGAAIDNVNNLTPTSYELIE